jgi:uncharacterized protein (DUF1330 family)
VKSNYKIALALFAGAAMGGAAVHGLHAQGKPTAYVVGEVDVTNQDAFVKDYVPLAMKALGERTSVIEGDPPKRIVINSFDSLDQAVAAYNSAAYKKRPSSAASTERSASLPSRDCHSEWHPSFGNNTGIVTTSYRSR